MNLPNIFIPYKSFAKSGLAVTSQGGAGYQRLRGHVRGELPCRRCRPVGADHLLVVKKESLRNLQTGGTKHDSDDENLSENRNKEDEQEDIGRGRRPAERQEIVSSTEGYRRKRVRRQMKRN